MTTPNAAAATAREVTAIILAAGRSTRMKTALPKVLHEVCGRPMLAYVLDACRGAGIRRVCVVVGYGKDTVMAAFSGDGDITWIEQAEQKGTGHAVQMCEPALRDFVGDVVIIAGDMPLIHTETLNTLMHTHRRSGAALTLATTILDVAVEYGRIARDEAGRLTGIVEYRDCTADQRNIREMNPSYYCFDSRRLFSTLRRIDNRNAKGEFYLTDAVALLIGAGERVEAVAAVPAEDAVGVNSRRDLAEINDLMRRRILNRWMDDGVTIVDPGTTWIEAGAVLGEDAVIEPFSYIERDAVIGRGARIGPFAHVPGGARVPEGGRFGPNGEAAAISAALRGRMQGAER